MLLTSGYIADFKTSYLQIAIPEHRCEVMDGTDGVSGLTAGFAAGRLVKLVRLADGTCYITVPANVTATSIGDATHIVAQTDDSLHGAIRTEALNFMATGLLKNTTVDAAATDAPTAATATMKRVALWKIVNADDVKIIPVKHSTISVVR